MLNRHGKTSWSVYEQIVEIRNAMLNITWSWL